MLQVLEEERRKLLLQEQNLIAAHNEQLTKLRSHLGTIDEQICRLKQSQSQRSESDSWKCVCGKMLKGERKRCGKCLRWRGGKRGRGSNPPMIQCVVSSNEEAEVETEPPKTRKRGRKSSGDSASAVSIDDEQAAASLISLSLSL